MPATVREMRPARAGAAPPPAQFRTVLRTDLEPHEYEDFGAEDPDNWRDFVDEPHLS